MQKHYKIAKKETLEINRKISQLQLKINDALQSCNVRTEEKIKDNFFDSLLLFKLESLKFEVISLDDSDSEEEDTTSAEFWQRRRTVSMKRKGTSGDSSEAERESDIATKKMKISSVENPTMRVVSEVPTKKPKDGHCANKEKDPSSKKRKRHWDGPFAKDKVAAKMNNQVCLKLKLKRDGESWVSSFDHRVNGILENNAENTVMRTVS